VSIKITIETMFSKVICVTYPSL